MSNMKARQKIPVMLPARRMYPKELTKLAGKYALGWRPIADCVQETTELGQAVLNLIADLEAERDAHQVTVLELDRALGEVAIGRAMARAAMRDIEGRPENQVDGEER